MPQTLINSPFGEVAEIHGVTYGASLTEYVTPLAKYNCLNY